MKTQAVVKDEFERLLENGKKLTSNIQNKCLKENMPITNVLKLFGTDPFLHSFRQKYEQWYSEAFYLVSQVLGKRTNDMKSRYASISKAFDEDNGVRAVKTYENIHSGLRAQVGIVASLSDRLDHVLYELTSSLEVQLFENQLDEADYLLRNKHIRASGAVAGVILEGHLQTMLITRDLKCNKKHLTIGELTAKLYEEEIISSVDNKLLIYLGGIRNKCDHKNEEEPTKKEVQKLIFEIRDLMKRLT